MATVAKIVVIEQEALTPWFSSGQIDLADAVLLHHVLTRFTRRLHQKILIHAGHEFVWVHYATIRAENPAIRLSDSQLRRRFSKLIALGLLERCQEAVAKSSGEWRGSRAYFRIGDVYKARLQLQDKARGKSRRWTPEGTAEPCTSSCGSISNTSDRAKMSGHSKAPKTPPRYDRAKMSGQSLGIKNSEKVVAGAIPVGADAPSGEPLAVEPFKASGENEEALKDRALRRSAKAEAAQGSSGTPLRAEVLAGRCAELAEEPLAGAKLRSKLSEVRAELRTNGRLSLSRSLRSESDLCAAGLVCLGGSE